MKGQISPLTSLRFVFAFMVFLSHLSFNSIEEGEGFAYLYSLIFKEGYLGVSFFFILSGFILAYNYENKFQNNAISRKSFFIARFARIYPLHLLTFFIAIPLTFKEFNANATDWFMSAVLNLGLVQSFVPMLKYYFSFNVPTWSISNEMFFYVLFPFILSPLVKVTQSRNQILLFFTILLVVVLLPTFIVAKEWEHPVFYVNPFYRISDFILGIILFGIRKHMSLKWFKRGNVSEITALGIMLVFFIFYSKIPQVYRFSVYYWIPMVFLILSFSFEKGVISKFLSNRVFIILGEISFGFYMLHFLILRYLDFINGNIFYIGNEYIITTIALIIALAASYLAYYWFEKPVNKHIRKRFS